MTATLDVMTFNLRMPVRDREPGHPDHWLTRLPAAIELVRERRPAVIGTQEGCDPQWNRLLPELPHYQRLGTGRERSHKGEYSAILIDTEVVEVADWTQFTLSETPDVLGSQSWESSCTRVAVVADLVVKATGERFTLANTHLDHVSEQARVEGTRLIRSRTPRQATVVTGDFNCTAGEAAAWHDFVDDGFVDTWLVDTRDADESEAVAHEAVDTFHGYSEPGVAGEQPVRIDWILATPDVGVVSSEIVTDRPGGVWPSDHWPVVATLRLG